MRYTNFPTEKRQAMNAEAYSRATSGQSMSNFAQIFQGFEAKGIPADQIEPRVNVLTFNAWLAVGRHVRKGEHGVRVLTYVTAQSKNEAEPVAEGGKNSTYRFPRGVTVFHISQTDPDVAPANPVATSQEVAA